ncbi:IS66 family transposase [Niastella sp. OAS944]|uniref:IS66 family transposase n=1 Tax=Niastella sp. OAS944 TaxID=2664089 RepID=UPI00348FF7C7|nr:transposase [Chitinophagaceae bacterium OAS944]
MLITPEHQALQDKYQQLLFRSMQFDAIIEQKDEVIQQLKNEITPLKNAVEQLIVEVKLQREENASLLNIIKEKDKRLQKLELIEYQYQQLTKLVYSRSSEKSSAIIPGQLQLGINTDVVEVCNINDGQKIESYTKLKSEKKKHPGRNEIPAHIERKYIDMHPENLPEDAEHFDTIETEQLEYDPARLFATVYRRYKYKRSTPNGSTEFFIASLPEEKDKSLAAPSLKAHVTTEKFLWHMPIHRQMQKFAQSGIILSENTIGDWINGTCRSLTAIYDALRQNIVKPACGYMMADETRIDVLDSEKVKGKKSHLDWMWSYCNPVDRLVFFEYHKGRGNKDARPVLQNYQGYLHSDGFNVYKHFGSQPGVTHICCNAHARRKFHEAKLTDKTRAEHALMLYSKLYGIESYCKEQNLSFDQRFKIRQEKSVPIFDELAGWIKEQIPMLTTLRSPIGKALAYFSEREKQLGMFLHDGMLLMDTNLIENAIRPIALGRNNFLFAGSHDAAQNAAIIYSLLATCKLHDVNAYDWLKYVLTAMPTFPASRIKELLPHNWKGSIIEP